MNKQTKERPKKPNANMVRRAKVRFRGDMVVTKVSFVVDRNCRDENSDSQSRGDGVAVARIYANAEHVKDNEKR